jgi:hypothetical protein
MPTRSIYQPNAAKRFSIHQPPATLQRSPAANHISTFTNTMWVSAFTSRQPLCGCASLFIFINP